MMIHRNSKENNLYTCDILCWKKERKRM